MNSGAKYFHVICVSPKLFLFPEFRPERTRRTSPCKGDNLGITHIESGFPHSEIRGLTGVRPSPRLIAAYHVLHRLSMPRHPPNALKTLDHSHRRCSRLARIGKERPACFVITVCKEHLAIPSGLPPARELTVMNFSQ